MANPQVPFQERMKFLGSRLTSQPDALPPGKFAATQNIRANPDGTSIYTRPGSVQQFTTSNNAITDIRAFATLSTDDKPRFLARDTLNKIWGDTNNASPLVTLAGNNGFGVSMIPFRPSASPQSYMYVAGIGDYQKISAFDANNNVTVSNAGIAEPQSECEFNVMAPDFTAWTGVANNWATGGNAANATDSNRSTENISLALADPIVTTRFSMQPANNGSYQAGEILSFTGANNTNLGTAVVQQVLPPLAGGNAMQVLAIAYDTGSTGFCTIVPSQVPVAGELQVGYFQHGSLMRITQGNNNEGILILSVTPGPSGGVSLRASTNNTYTTGATLNGIPAIIVDNNNVALGNATSMNATAINWQVTGPGNNVASTIGTLTLTQAANPFATVLGSSTSLPQYDDYIHLSLNIDDPTKILQIMVMFNVDANDTSFTNNILYYSLQPSSLAQVPSGNVTQLAAILAASNNATVASQATSIQNQIAQIQAEQSSGQITPDVAQAQITSLNVQLVNLESLTSAPGQTVAGSSQWTELLFPIAGLTRIGNDQSRTLMNLAAAGIRIFAQVSGTVNLRVSSCWVGGGGQPDTGDTGAPYQYRIVPRATKTGAQGNPSPVPVYGVYGRRQKVLMAPPSLAYDSQIDVYDVYRYGGTVTSWRYIGTQTAGNNYTDNFFDDTAQAGQVLIADNFQPWPSVDVPWSTTANNSVTIKMNGTIVIVSGATFPASIGSWLPGTLVQLNNLSAYPLWARPVNPSNGTWVFKFGQTTGSGNANSIVVQEPIVARQFNPYVWGPDMLGTVFGCGDPLRPGTLSYAKQNAPDQVSSRSNIDLCPPSEPLLGGETIDGLSLGGSTKRWWALYPNLNGPGYNPVERPVGRGIAAPYGHCTDGTRIFFWAKDCIAATDGGAFQALTDADLYPLFPHDGSLGANVIRNAVTFYAPDYSRAAQFRLTYINSYLYADYPDSTGTYRTLVCDLRTGAWSSDSYATAVSGRYAVEQQAGTVLSSGTSYADLMMGLVSGNVNKQVNLSNDNVITGNNGSNGTGITCVVQTREWDGGAQQVNGLWRDPYVDAVAPNGYNATPMSLGASSGNTTAIAAFAFRRLSQVPQDPGTVQRFCGVQLEWTDTF